MRRLILGVLSVVGVMPNLVGQSLDFEQSVVCLETPIVQAKAIRFVFGATSFPGLNDDDTYHLRLRFPPLLAETLVGNGQPPMPLIVKSASVATAGCLAIPVDAIEVERWRAHERDIWISINSDPASWVEGLCSCVEHYFMCEVGGNDAALVLDMEDLDLPQIPYSVEVLGQIVQNAVGVTTASDPNQISFSNAWSTLDSDSRLLQISRCDRIYFPWVTNNQSFNSSVVFIQDQAPTMQVGLRLYDASGLFHETAVDVPRGLYNVEASSLFGQLNHPGGFSVVASVLNPQDRLGGMWSIQHSSQAINSYEHALQLTDDYRETDGVGRKLFLGPIDNQFSAALVISTPTDSKSNAIVQAFLDGVLSTEVEVELEPFMPFVSMLGDMFSEPVDEIRIGSNILVTATLFQFEPGGEVTWSVGQVLR